MNKLILILTGIFFYTLHGLGSDHAGSGEIRKKNPKIEFISKSEYQKEKLEEKLSSQYDVISFCLWVLEEDIPHSDAWNFCMEVIHSSSEEDRAPHWLDLL